jgi:EthD domain-containing protein
MFTVFGFLTKKDGLSMREFIDHYENKHVPLICNSAPVPLVYKRRYLTPDDRLTIEGGEIDFDVMTELVFADRSAFEAWMAQLAKPEVGARIVADEEKFLDRSRTRAYVIEERVARE